MTPTLIKSYFLIFLAWFCARTIKRLLADGREHEGIGILDRIWEMKTRIRLPYGSSLSVVRGKPHCFGTIREREKGRTGTVGILGRRLPLECSGKKTSLSSKDSVKCGRLRTICSCLFGFFKPFSRKPKLTVFWEFLLFPGFAFPDGTYKYYSYHVLLKTISLKLLSFGLFVFSPVKPPFP